MEITAAVSRGAEQPISVESVTLDEPRPDEVLVRLVACGICHTDLVTRQAYPAGLPIVLGHEGAGIVERVGAEVTGVTVGDHVLLSYSSCGECARCADGFPGYCHQWMLLNTAGARADGSSPLHAGGERLAGAFFGQSSFATHVLTQPRNLVIVDDELDLTVTAPFGCGVQTGAGTVANVLRPDDSSTLVIFGVGGVGMAALLAGRALGVRTLVAVDLSAERLSLARELGADAVINGAADVVAQVKTATGGGASHALDTTGIPAVITNAIDALAPRGTLALVALGEPAMNIEIAQLIGQGKTLCGSIEGDGDPRVFIPQLIRWYREGKFPIDKIVRTYPFEKIDEAMADAHRGTVIKPVLTFG